MIEQILSERASTHGDFKDHAECSQKLKKTMWECAGMNVLTSTKWEALEMIQHKVARILSGDSGHIDHWDDIAGYATLVANQLRGEQYGQEPTEDIDGSV